MALIVIACLGMAGAREGTLCPMTSRPMAEHVAAANAHNMTSMAVSDECAKAMRLGHQVPSNRPDNGGSHHASQCCAGYSMPIGIPSTGPAVAVAASPPVPIDHRPPFLKDRLLAPEPPPPRSSLS